ncbi:hypothetical protein [Candidatus Phyllobacterium onerii]|jgi:hypothetical protein|uniref:hypothetical protein n=1 Tax=Candidatus Phyllobacterium onerii TaxID=3020828 RepID=UPI00232D5A3B|nr:hypothetical protein [Phyllobacterium sp. IY22]
MLANTIFIIFWMTIISVGAILVARHEVNQSQKETDDRIAEITRELKRRATPAE